MALTDLYPFMVVDLPRCLNPVKLQALQEATRRFCRESEVVRIDHPAIDLVKDQTAYDLDAFVAPHNSGWSMRRLVEVKQSGVILRPELYDLGYPDTETPAVVFVKAAIPSVAVTDGLEVKCVMVPAKLSPGALPAPFEELWADAIVAGAKSALMMMPEQPWTNYAVGKVESAKYNAFVASARREVEIKQKGGDLVAHAGSWL